MRVGRRWVGVEGEKSGKKEKVKETPHTGIMGISMSRPRSRARVARMRASVARRHDRWSHQAPTSLKPRGDAGRPILPRRPAESGRV